jgi:ADP-heptose:LPS heptosyltransferase
MPDTRLQFAIANLGTIDDVLLTTPLLESVRKTHPTSRITTIVSRNAAQILDYSPFVNELIIWPNDGPRRRSGMQMIRKLWRRRFTAAVVLTPNPYLNAGLLIGRTPKRIQASSLAAAAKDLGVQAPNDTKLNYTVTATEKASALVTLSRWGVYPEKQAVLAIWPGTWPTDHYREVIEQVSNSASFRIVILGDREERRIVSQLLEKPVRHTIDLTSRLNFREMVAVLAQCHAVLPGIPLAEHLGSATGIHCLAASEKPSQIIADLGSLSRGA